MRKLVFIVVLMTGFSGWMMSQQPSTNAAPNATSADSVPVVVVVEDLVIDSVPLFTPTDMGMLLTDTMPTPQWMTLQMIQVGAIEPEQTDQINQINTRFVRRVQDVGSKPALPNRALRGAAAAHDDELKATLSDQQEKAYGQIRDKMHKRVWYHYVCKHRKDGCDNKHFQEMRQERKDHKKHMKEHMQKEMGPEGMMQ